MNKNFIITKIEFPKESELVPCGITRIHTKEQLFSQALILSGMATGAFCVFLILNLLAPIIPETETVSPNNTGEMAEIANQFVQQTEIMADLLGAMGFLIGIPLVFISFLKFKRWLGINKNAKLCVNPLYLEHLYRNLEKYDQRVLEAMAYHKEYSNNMKEDILGYLVEKKGVDKNTLVKPQTLFEAVTDKEDSLEIPLEDNKQVVLLDIKK